MTNAKWWNVDITKRIVNHASRVGSVLWNRPVCQVMVRYTRYTYELMEEAGAFTVNVPSPGMERVMAF